MENKYLLNILVFFIFIAVLIVGCSQSPENKAASEKPAEEAANTGALSVKSAPSQARLYVDGELKGATPFDLYNIPVGTHNLIVKKEGYTDFEKSIVIKVGKTEEIEAVLTSLTPIKSAVEENKAMAEKVAENPALSSPKLKSVNLSSYIVYFDFKRELFTDTTTSKPDIFSANYNTYVYFTAISPARMHIVNKQVKEVKKEDCINADNTIANLYSDQTLCVKTTEGFIAAIGGSWTTSPGELEWVLFS